MISEYKLKNGDKRYFLNVYLGIDELTGEQIAVQKRGFKSIREAKNYESRLRLDYENNQNTQDKKEKMKFSQVTDEWLKIYLKSVKENTYIKEKDRIETQILPHFGNMYVNQITLKNCQSIVNDWYKHYTKANTLVSLVNRIFRYAINNGYADSNPMQHVIRPKNTHKKEYEAYFYDKDQLKYFLDCLENESLLVRTVFRALAFTGLRTGELLGLHWDDVDFNRKTISVNHVLVKLEDRYILQSPKNKASKRTIGVDDGTLGLLSELKSERCNSKFVFSNVIGEHLNIYYCNTALTRLISKYKLPKITTHGFRHTHCSLLFEAGVSVNDVKDRLGHSTIQTTLNIYSHVTKNKRKDTAEKFSEYMNF